MISTGCGLITNTRIELVEAVEKVEPEHDHI